MNQAFSVGHVKSEMLIKHPDRDVQEASEQAEMTFWKGNKLETEIRHLHIICILQPVN